MVGGQSKWRWRLSGARGEAGRDIIRQVLRLHAHGALLLLGQMRPDLAQDAAPARRRGQRVLPGSVRELRLEVLAQHLHELEDGRRVAIPPLRHSSAALRCSRRKAHSSRRQPAGAPSLPLPLAPSIAQALPSRREPSPPSSWARPRVASEGDVQIGRLSVRLRRSRFTNGRLQPPFSPVRPGARGPARRPFAWPGAVPGPPRSGPPTARSPPKAHLRW